MPAAPGVQGGHRPSGVVLVVTSEDDGFGPALGRATALAASRGEPLILYDWDAPSFFSEPLPTWWSSEGAEDAVPDRLDADQLETAGRPAVAEKVRAAGRTGVVAYGWLPSDHGAAGLADYAVAQQASHIVLPRDLEELGPLDAIVNGTARPVQELEHEVGAVIVVV